MALEILLVSRPHPDLPIPRHKKMFDYLSVTLNVNAIKILLDTIDLSDVLGTVEANFNFADLIG